MRGECLDGLTGVESLHAEEHPLEGALDVRRQKGRRLHHALPERPLDSQAVRADRGHVVSRVVDEDHLVSGWQERRTQGAADGPGPPDQDGSALGFAHSHGPSMISRVSATPTSQIACISASSR